MNPNQTQCYAAFARAGNGLPDQMLWRDRQKLWQGALFLYKVGTMRFMTLVTAVLRDQKPD